MTQILLTQKELAAKCDVAGSCISRLCCTKFKPALVGRRIDINHSIIKKYIEKHTGLTTKQQNDKNREPIEIPTDIKDFADMTLNELIQKFGTDTAFVEWLRATKSIEDINEKRLKNAVTQGELVDRKLIKKGVIEPFDTAFNKLLTDGAKTIARRVSSMANSGRPVVDCEKFVTGQISSFIKPMKAKIARTLRSA